jgi:quinolinate synthase
MEDLSQKIRQVCQEKNAVILAHYYQSFEVQQIADYVGDSLGLAQKALQSNADIIVFAGVVFMAETAKILNSSKKVLVPDLLAGCSLVEGCAYDDFKAFKEKYPDHEVVMYINSSAQVKSLSDVICTSSNAVDIVNAIPADKKIIFAPDKHLGDYVKKVTGRDMVLWDGECVVHQAFSNEKIDKLFEKYPTAKLIAHPESPKELLKRAVFIGSTTALIKFVKESEYHVLLIGTEVGVIAEMKRVAPHKVIVPLPVEANNTCACSECAYMKLNTLQKIYDALVSESPEILVDDKLAAKALLPLDRMLQFSK